MFNDIAFYVISAIGVLICCYLLFLLLFKSKRQIKARMENIRKDINYEADDNMYDESILDRIIYPLYEKSFLLISRFTPENLINEYSKVLLEAGLSLTYTPVQLLIRQLLLTSIAVTISGIITRIIFSQVNILIVAFFGLLFFYIPLYDVRIKSKKRRDRIQRDLASFLDLIYISVEAGLGFDSAMRKTAEKMNGPLSVEVLFAMDDISKGRNRVDALRSIGERTQVGDVKSFIATVIQSESLGSNIANVLRVQSKDIRDKQLQRTEEAAMKIPIKMLFPLIFCLLPALFIVIMGPAVINVIRLLSDL